MKKSFFFLIAINCFFISFSQVAHPSKYIKISGGKVGFGTGDVPGYGIYIEGCGSFIRKNKYLATHIQLGGEIYFQSGVKNPKVENPQPAQFFNISFKHYSIAGLNGKISFYPFKRILKGFNVSAAGGVAFQNYSYESRAELMQYTSDFSRRMSELRFENSFLAGYTISLGYDFYLIKDKLLLGARYDLANYNNGDYNSMLGGKVGFAF